MLRFIGKLLNRNSSQQSGSDQTTSRCNGLVQIHIDDLARYKAICESTTVVLTRELGGIFKRISENRELLEELEHESLHSNDDSNVFYLLAAHHQFLLELAIAMQDIDSYSLKFYGELHRIGDIEVFERVAKRHDKFLPESLIASAWKARSLVEN